MFKIETTKLNNEIEHEYLMNRNEDDFVRFLPRRFGVPKENVKVYTIDDSKKFELEAYLNLGPEYALDIGETGKIKVVTIAETVNETTGATEITTTLVKEYVGTLIQWPYKENNLMKGKKLVHLDGLEFLGNGFEL